MITFSLWGSHRLKPLDDAQYADTVEATTKHVIRHVSERYPREPGEELDGADLMHRAFKSDAPRICLANTATRTNKNEQAGYRDIFVDQLTAVRNPVYDDREIESEQAVHYLFLCVLLHR